MTNSTTGPSVTELPEHGELLSEFVDPAVLFSHDNLILVANDAYCHLYGMTNRQRNALCYEVSHHFKLSYDKASEIYRLKNSMKRAILLADGGQILPEYLPLRMK